MISATPTEAQKCAAFYQRYLTLRALKYFDNEAFVFHVANERKCTLHYALQLKRVGVVAGIYDYPIIAKGGKIAFLEFKRNAKCKLSPAQHDFRLLCASLGIKTHISWEVEDAIEFIKNI
jgi:hypothetical protein